MDKLRTRLDFKKLRKTLREIGSLRRSSLPEKVKNRLRIVSWYGRRKVEDICRFFEISKSWFYRRARARLRELAWGQYKMGVDRWFYWESTYYNNYQGDMGQTNVFQTAQTYGSYDGDDEVLGKTGWNYFNGDGVLLYPGTDRHYSEESYDLEGPFASLRLKHWRRGIQDVDYLTLAAKIDPVRTAEIVEEMVPVILWEVGCETYQGECDGWINADISWSTDPDVWEAARLELADIIEKGGSSETEPEPEPKPEEESTSRGIPGFPITSILAALVIYYLIRDLVK